jgi:hypothetical protein
VGQSCRGEGGVQNVRERSLAPGLSHSR